MIDTAHIILLISLMWYILFWAMTDTSPIAHFIANFRTVRGMFGVLMVFVMAIQALKLFQLDLPSHYQNPMSIWLGVPILILGLALACWAKIVMKTNWGVPAQHDIAKQKALVTSGPFMYTRNPIYLGLLLYFIGFELALMSWLLAATIPLFILIRMAIAKEETLLRKYFGKMYAAYCKKVPQLLPI
ncbi:MAG: isoprenylcysteine carboxylmethyltransferase family protein [Candidatus Gottesmanbacteria bacterium]|nr:isoprenylcysteine carboxylmethyltransferase family protein [Candidatus Gottesmanbacteria bacterium]